MHLVGLYTYCRMMHGAYSVKSVLHIYFDMFETKRKRRAFISNTMWGPCFDLCWPRRNNSQSQRDLSIFFLNWSHPPIITNCTVYFCCNSLYGLFQSINTVFTAVTANILHTSGRVWPSAILRIPAPPPARLLFQRHGYTWLFSDILTFTWP